MITQQVYRGILYHSLEPESLSIHTVPSTVAGTEDVLRNV